MIMPFSQPARLAVAGLLALSIASAAHADGMVPETTVVVIDDVSREASIRIRNTDDVPALLLTELQDIPEDEEEILLVTTPLARVEPGDTQLVRVVLRKGVSLTTERLKRISFEGVKPKQLANSGAQVAISFKQSIPVIIRPASLPIEHKPWTRLTWAIEGDQLVVRNDSPYVVRLANSVQLLPSRAELDLEGTYLLPGARRSMPLREGAAANATSVQIIPATTYGFAVERYEAPLSPH